MKTHAQTSACGMSRRGFLLAGIQGLAAAALLHSRWIEPFWPEISHRKVLLPKPFSRPLTIAHISDLHAFGSMPLWYLENSFQLLAQETPDLICLTGDYISSTLPSAQDAARYSRLLRILSDAAPCAACLGNHDGGQWASRFGAGDSWEEAAGILSDANIRCLVNETTMYQCRGQQVVVAGTADLWSAPVAFDETNQNLLHTAAPLIMLAHNPDTKDAIANLPWDIMLSGHTHGGQLIYPFSNKTPFSVVRDRRFMAGLHRWNDRWLHVSRGLGTWRGVRINCPPEMTLLSLESCN